MLIRIICINAHCLADCDNYPSAPIIMSSPCVLTPSFLDAGGLQIVCNSPGAADVSWKLLIEKGLDYLRARDYETAFIVVGGALQIACKKVTSAPVPNWQWAMRMVESSNIIVVVLRALGFQELVVPLMHHVERQIEVITDLSECPPGKDASWLCRWCQSMHCALRQDQLLVRYSSVTAQTVHWQHH